MSGSIPREQAWAVALHSCFALLDFMAEFCTPCVTFGEKKTSPITTVAVTVDRIDATGHLLSWVSLPCIRFPRKEFVAIVFSYNIGNTKGTFGFPKKTVKEHRRGARLQSPSLMCAV